MKFLQRIWWYITDTIVPPDEEHLVVRHLDSLADYVRVQPYRGAIALMLFRDPVVRAVIHEAKFRGNTKAHRLLGQVLAAYLQATCGADVRICMVPIPLSAQRFRERGYNQAAEIVRAALLSLPNAQLGNTLLRRTKHTTPQTELGRTERTKNIRGAFGVQARRRAVDTEVRTVYVLVDDVTTTGSTLREARPVLMEHVQAGVVCIALAH